MKKLLIYLSIIIVLFALLYYFNQLSEREAMDTYAAPAEDLYKTSPDQLNSETREQLTDPEYQNIILPDELEARLDQNEDMFVYFFSPVCPYCVESTPIFNQIASDVDVELMQFNVLEFSFGFQQYGFESTPTIIYFENGEPEELFTGGIAHPERQEAFRSFLEMHKH